MSDLSRRELLVVALLAGGAAPEAAGATEAASHGAFVKEAERMRDTAVAAGDQAYGAVLVIGDAIVGYGPSRVVSERNPNAHAERVALWDAQKRLGRTDLDGAIVYATSIPCAACQEALARAGVGRMRVGATAEDRGPPRGTR